MFFNPQNVAWTTHLPLLSALSMIHVYAYTIQLKSYTERNTGLNHYTSCLESKERDVKEASSLIFKLIRYLLFFLCDISFSFYEFAMLNHTVGPSMPHSESSKKLTP